MFEHHGHRYRFLDFLEIDPAFLSHKNLLSVAVFIAIFFVFCKLDYRSALVISYNDLYGFLEPKRAANRSRSWDQAAGKVTPHSTIAS